MFARGLAAACAIRRICGHVLEFFREIRFVNGSRIQLEHLAAAFARVRNLAMPALPGLHFNGALLLAFILVSESASPGVSFMVSLHKRENAVSGKWHGCNLLLNEKAFLHVQTCVGGDVAVVSDC